MRLYILHFWNTATFSQFSHHLLNVLFFLFLLVPFQDVSVGLFRGPFQLEITSLSSEQVKLKENSSLAGCLKIAAFNRVG